MSSGKATISVCGLADDLDNVLHMRLNITFQGTAQRDGQQCDIDYIA